jgi:hypothetical protein
MGIYHVLSVSQMSQTSVDLIIGIVTFVLSVGTSMFIAGSRYGEMRSDMRMIADRLAKIEGMFTLKLRDKDSN